MNSYSQYFCKKKDNCVKRTEMKKKELLMALINTNGYCDNSSDGRGMKCCVNVSRCFITSERGNIFF